MFDINDMETEVPKKEDFWRQENWQDDITAPENLSGHGMTGRTTRLTPEAGQLLFV
ncbi:hypothetical protein [Eisenbergiella sp.]